MLERKIVRLIIMSNISRRQFLKSASVATLAVAAAGVLAGCSKEDIPQVPDVTTDVVTVYFFDKTLDNGKGGGIGDTYKMEVLKGDLLDPTKIPAEAFPKGYVLESEAPVKVEDDGNGKKLALVPVKVYKEESESPSKTRVKITLSFTTPGNKPRELTVDVNKLFAPEERLVFADFKDALYAKYDDVEIWNEGWSSPLERMDGYYKASFDFPVKIKGSNI